MVQNSDGQYRKKQADFGCNEQIMNDLQHTHNPLVQGSNPCGPTLDKPFKTKGLKAKKRAAVDTSPTAMNPTGDKLATTQETALSTTLPAPRPKAKRGAKGKPVSVARFGSAAVPVYRCAAGGRIRFALSYHREGRRMRQFFGDLAAAKKEALLVAQRIQNGMQQMTDLKPHERESFLAARAKLGESGVPLVAAVEDYAQCRKLLGDIPLRQAVEDFCRRSNGIDERNDVEGGNEPGYLADEAEILECFHGDMGRCQRQAAGAGENWFAGRLAACYRLFMQTTFQSVDGRCLHFPVVELPAQRPVGVPPPNSDRPVNRNV